MRAIRQILAPATSVVTVAIISLTGNVHDGPAAASANVVHSGVPDHVSPCLKPTLPRRLPPTHAAISTSPTTTKAGCDAAYAADIVACQVKYPNSALKRKQCYELAVVEYAACLAEATGVSPAEVNDRYLWRRLVRAAA